MGTLTGAIDERRRAKADYMRRWRAGNLEHSKELEAASRERHREVRRERDRAYYAANRDAIVARRKPVDDAEMARKRRWSDAHPERARQLATERQQRRQARLSAAMVERVDRAAVIARDGGICGICAQPVSISDVELDHIIPLALGGRHSSDNLQVAHSRCNRRKGARLLGPFPKGDLP